MEADDGATVGPEGISVGGDDGDCVGGRVDGIGVVVGPAVACWPGVLHTVAKQSPF